MCTKGRSWLVLLYGHCLLSSAIQVFVLSSTGKGLVSGGADGYVKVLL